jgi:hypothetical protein
MAKFNVGDVVRCVDNEHTDGELLYGKEYRVTGNDKFHHISLDGGTKSWSDSRFVSVNSGPIHTRREIVPGVYGIVHVTVRGNVEIEEKDGYTPEELREAAHILNQIAEVLEENAK